MDTFQLPADSLEYTVLVQIWELGQVSVRDLHERIGVPAGTVYTTTAKVVDRLRDKGLIERIRVGGAFLYRPCVDRSRVEQLRARTLLGRFLGQAPRAAAAALVEAAADIEPRLIDELEQAIQKLRNENSDGA